MGSIETSKVIPSLTFAGVMGGLSTIVSTFVYAFTHGTTTVNKMESLLGMNELEWGRIFAIIPILLLASLWAFRLRIGSRVTKLVTVGFWVTSAALAMRLLSEIPQFFINMRTDYQSLLGISSWMMFLFSLPLLTIGMLIICIGCRSAGMSRSAFYVTLFIGLSIIPTVLVGGIVSSTSDDSMIYRISMGLLSLPQGLAWSWLASITPFRSPALK